MKRLLWLLTILPVLVLSGWAQTPLRLSLEEAVQMALRQNPAIAEAQRAIEEADARVRQARADSYPQLGFNGIAKLGLSGATNGLGLVGLPNSPFYRNLADSLNASYRVFDFGRTKHHVRIERLRHEAAQADLAATEASVIRNSERAFYALLRARRLREVAAEIVRSRQQTVRQAQAFYEGKIRSRLDLDLARVGLSQSQLALVEAENAVRAAVADLGRALGASQEADYDLLSPDLSLPPPEPEPLPGLIQAAHEQRPELRSLRAQRDAAAESVSLARSRRRPLLSFVFSGGYSRFPNTVARQLLAAGAGLALPGFTGGNLEAQIEEAQARLRVLESRAEDLRQEVALEIRRAYWQVQNAVQAIPTRKLQVQYAGEAVRLARARYRERLGSIVELTQAETALADAEAGVVTSIYQMKTAQAELRLAIGRR